MEKNQTTLLKEELLKAVVIANRFISPRPTLPVLANLLIKSEKGKIVIGATNLETSVRLTIPAKSDSEWEITILAKIAAEFIASAQSKEINLAKEKEAIKIFGDGVSGTLSGIDASEFPKLPEVGQEDTIEFQQKSLQEAINQIAFAASVEESKPVLTGILIRSEEGKTIAVATDGYRLARKDLGKEYKVGETLISAKSLVEVLKIAGEMGEEVVNLTISKEKNQTIFSGDSFQISGRLLDGVYPNFKQIIPQTFIATASVNREELSAAIKAAAVFARDIGNVVKFNLEIGKEIKITANTAQIGEGNATVAAAIEGENLTVAFNSHYLLEGLNGIKSETVEINFSGPLSPALLRDANDKSYIYIIMPVKAQN
jgi:DNA polymerase-3 subunit beta